MISFFHCQVCYVPGILYDLLQEAILLFLGPFHINHSITLDLQNVEKTRISECHFCKHAYH